VPHAATKCASFTKTTGMKAKLAGSTTFDPHVAKLKKELKKQQVLRHFVNFPRSVRDQIVSTALRRTMAVTT
jgi:hypothetical protein